jgi:hypothetical protein
MDDIIGRQQGHVGQQPLGAADRIPGDAAGRDHMVPGPAQRGAEDGAHPSGSHHAHREPDWIGHRRVALLARSAPQNETTLAGL